MIESLKRALLRSQKGKRYKKVTIRCRDYYSRNR